MIQRKRGKQHVRCCFPVIKKLEEKLELRNLYVHFELFISFDHSD